MRLVAGTCALLLTAAVLIAAGAGTAVTTRGFPRSAGSGSAIGLLVAGGIAAFLWLAARFVIQSEFGIAETAAKAAAQDHVKNVVIPRWRSLFDGRGVFVDLDVKPYVRRYGDDRDPESVEEYVFAIPPPTSAYALPARREEQQVCVHITMGAPFQWPLYYDKQGEAVYRDEVAHVGSHTPIVLGPPIDDKEASVVHVRPHNGASEVALRNPLRPGGSGGGDADPATPRSS